MTVGFALRSLLALLLAVGVALVGLSQSAAPPTPATAAALTEPGERGNGVVYQPQVPPTVGPATPVGPDRTPLPGRGHQPIPPRQVIQPSAEVAQLPLAPGHIFFTAPDHNLYFVTGRHPRKKFTGDGTTVAPTFSTDGSQLAWVKLKRNFSDIYVTPLGYDAATGAVIPIGAAPTWVTETNESPPPALQQPGCQTPPGFQPRYEWWATKPSFLPDGQHLVYVTNRPGYCPDGVGLDNADGSIYEQGVTGTITDAVRLTIPSFGTGGDDSPVWRPRDPAVFVYAHYYYGPDLPNPEGIIQAGLAVTGTAPTDADITSLTPHKVLAELPAWSPDGRYIAFVEDHQNTKSSAIKVMRFHRPGAVADYYHAQTVARGAPYVTQPFWSPKGDYLGYLTSSGGDFTLVIRPVIRHGATLTFGKPIPITQAQTADAGYRPAWGP